MHARLLILTVLPPLLSAACAPPPGGRVRPHALLAAPAMDAVTWTDGFWGDRFATCRNKTIPAIRRMFLDPRNEGARLTRLRYAAGLQNVNPGGKHWADGDCYKWIETMARVYAVKKDAALATQMDEWIDVIARAQEPDGYISTNIGHDTNARFRSPHHHELYNMGHLLTAAAVHCRATGKETFLAVARKLGDYLDRTFRPTPARLVNFPWNPSVYMGLVDLYRVTGERRYLQTAAVMIANRGSAPQDGRDHRKGGTDQTQDRVPLRKETLAVGHAVTGMYLYCGAADLCAETGEAVLLKALERVWTDTTRTKMDITGGVGYGHGTSPRGDPMHEAFGKQYQLPNRYNETCADIAAGMFSRRMLLLTGEPQYAEIMERVAFNSLTAAVDLAGERFFYCNPLRWPPQNNTKHHTAERWAFHRCCCCPPQVARITAAVHTWFYGIAADGLWVHLYGAGRLKTALADGTPVALTQETDYPWDGAVALTIDRAPGTPLTLRLRIPAWADGATLRLNGRPLDVPAAPGTYAAITRTWTPGDRLELDLPMRVRLMAAHPAVEALRNRVAVMRGPLVYCLELPRREGGRKTWDAGVFLPENIRLTPERRPGFLGGVTVLTGRALTRAGRERFVKDCADARPPKTRTGDDRLYRPLVPRRLYHPTEGTVDVTLIPYYAWANRGPALMEVWIPLAR